MKDTRMMVNYLHAPCDMFACRNRAAFYIGREHVQRVSTLNLCDECTDNLLLNLTNRHIETVLKGAKNRDLISKDVELKEEEDASYQVNTSEAQEQAKEKEGETDGGQRESSTKQEVSAQTRNGTTAEGESTGSEQPKKSEKSTNEGSTKQGFKTEDNEVEQPAPAAKKDEVESEDAGPEIEERNELGEMNVDQLREVAKDKGISKYYDMRKDELIEAIKGQEDVNEDS